MTPPPPNWRFSPSGTRCLFRELYHEMKQLYQYDHEGPAQPKQKPTSQEQRSWQWCFGDAHSILLADFLEGPRMIHKQQQTSPHYKSVLRKSAKALAEKCPESFPRLYFSKKTMLLLIPLIKPGAILKF